VRGLRRRRQAPSDPAFTFVLDPAPARAGDDPRRDTGARDRYLHEREASGGESEEADEPARGDDEEEPATVRVVTERE